MLLRLRGFLSPPRCEAVQAVHGERERGMAPTPKPGRKKEEGIAMPGREREVLPCICEWGAVFVGPKDLR